MEQRLFIRHPEEWDSCFGESHQLKDHAEVQVVENGVVLPLVPIPESELEHPLLDIACRGGVCDRDLSFIAGHQRNLDVTPGNLDCLGSYDVDTADIDVRHEEVVFGGILYDHLGHTIADTFTRLWHLFENPGFEKVVFLQFPYVFPSQFDCMELVLLLGIPDEKMEIIERPTMFDKVIVPEEAFFSFNGHLPEFKLPFRHIASTIGQGDTPAKVYLSRRQFQTDESMPRRIINEAFFERFFSAHGFEIVCPELLSIEEQVRVVANADEIVATIGTLSHMFMFAKDDARTAILIREVPMFIQANIDEARGITPYYVDASSNPLPVDQAHGPFLMMPNRFFKEYLDETGVDYAADELDISDEQDELIMQFLREWAKTYREPGATNHHVADESMFDVIRRMNDALFDSTFNEDDYLDANRLAVARQERDAAVYDIERMKDSTSWKLTKPVRALKDLALALRK